MRTTLGYARNNIEAELTLGFCPSDERVVRKLNEATCRLLPMGKWVGTIQRYQFCVNDNCLTLPRQIETVEAYAVCSRPGTVRNGWYEFLHNGPGVLSENSCICGQLIQSMTTGHVGFNDIVGTKKIRLWPDIAADVGKQILLQGYDENGQWILTSGGNVNGELVTLAMPYAESTKTYSSLVGVQKPVTKGNVRAYSFNAADSTSLGLAIWEPDETTPSYRRVLIPNLRRGSSGEGCLNSPVAIEAKLAFIPVVNDTDYLIIGHTPALKDMVQSIRKLENNLVDDAIKYEMMAVAQLQRQLDSFMGDGEEVPIKFPSSDVYGGGVLNLI